MPAILTVLRHHNDPTPRTPNPELRAPNPERPNVSADFYTRYDPLPGIKVDGMDCFAVKQSVQFAREWTMSGLCVCERERDRVSERERESEREGGRECVSV